MPRRKSTPKRWAAAGMQGGYQIGRNRSWGPIEMVGSTVHDIGDSTIHPYAWAQLPNQAQYNDYVNYPTVVMGDIDQSVYREQHWDQIPRTQNYGEPELWSDPQREHTEIHHAPAGVERGQYMTAAEMIGVPNQQEMIGRSTQMSGAYWQNRPPVGFGANPFAAGSGMSRAQEFLARRDRDDLARRMRNMNLDGS